MIHARSNLTGVLVFREPDSLLHGLFFGMICVALTSCAIAGLGLWCWSRMVLMKGTVGRIG